MTLLYDLFRAWNMPGNNPRYHRKQQDRLKQEWPILYDLLNQLGRYGGFSDTPGSPHLGRPYPGVSEATYDIAMATAKRLLEGAEWMDVETTATAHSVELTSDEVSQVISLVRSCRFKVDPSNQYVERVTAFARESMGIELQPWQKEILTQAFEEKPGNA